MSAWVLPDHIADVLPSEARHIEELRRDLLDTAACYGYELVMPPLLEHLESLLSGTGEALDLQTFKLVDQLSGRMMGLRADSTPQVARIDAHLLNRSGVTRLCYCGPVLHTRPTSRMPRASRCSSAPRSTAMPGWKPIWRSCCWHSMPARRGGRGAQRGLADARIVRALLDRLRPRWRRDARAPRAGRQGQQPSCASCPAIFLPAVREGLLALVSLYGDAEVLARRARLARPARHAEALEPAWLAGHLGMSPPVQFDLADLRGYAYYSGARFSVFAPGPAMRWCAAGGMTRSVRSSAATARPSVSAWTSRRWWACAATRRCMRRSGRPGASRRICAGHRRLRAERRDRGVCAARPRERSR
jgi:ATP phosphoribosyltransferase regulatory subunit